MCAMPNAAQAATNWVNGMTNSGDKLRAGVNAVTQSPTQLAAAAADRMLAGIQRSITSGKWQNSLNNVTLQQWKDAMLNKGVPRVAQGATAAKGKFQAFLNDFLPYLASGQQQLNSTMPRGDLETNIGRSAWMARYNAQFRKT